MSNINNKNPQKLKLKQISQGNNVLVIMPAPKKVATINRETHGNDPQKQLSKRELKQEKKRQQKEMVSKARKPIVFEPLSDESKQQLQEATKAYIYSYLCEEVRFIKEIEPNYDCQPTKTMSASLLFEKYSKLKARVGLDSELRGKNKLYMQAKVQFLENAFKALNYPEEIRYHTLFLSRTYEEFCLTYHIHTDKRKHAQNLNFDSDFGQIEGLESVICDSIKKLKDFKEQYYSFFRQLLDPSTGFYQKAKEFLKYIGEDDRVTKLSAKQIFDQVYDNYNVITLHATCVNELSIFIDVLIKACQGTQGLNSLNFILEECKWISDKFRLRNDAMMYTMRGKYDGDCMLNHRNITKYLEKLLKDFSKIEQSEASKRIKQPIEETKEITDSIEKEAIKEKCTPAYNPIVEDEQAFKPEVLNITVDQDEKAEDTTTPSLIDENKFELKLKKTLELSDSIILAEELVTKKIATEPIQFEQDNEIKDNSEEALNDELIDLYAEIQKMIERDQKEKEQRKKQMHETKVLAPKNKEIETPLSVPLEQEIIRLSNRHKETLRTLFGPGSCDRKLSKQDVVTLVEALNGYTQEGSGNTTIYWGGNIRVKQRGLKGGVFEVIHGEDGKGLLKAGWADNVKKAVEFGVTIGHISPDILSDALEFLN